MADEIAIERSSDSVFADLGYNVCIEAMSSRTRSGGRMQVQVHSLRLVEAAPDCPALERAYADFVRAVLESPLWSSEHPDGLRIPWRSAREASTHPGLRNTFGSPGLYLFGSAAGAPLYLGMTCRALWKRLRGRYVHDRRSQCQLAADYEHQLVAGGLEGFPDEVRAWYRRSHRSSTVRLAGAVAFARHGIEGIWFALLPISDPELIRPLERRLIPVAEAWNRSHGYPPLLNLQDR